MKNGHTFHIFALEVIMKRSMIFAVVSLAIGIITGLSIYLYHFFYPEKYVKTDTGEYVNIAVANNPSTFPVSKKTQFVIEHYYEDEQRTLTENVGNIPVLLGCEKDGVESYLKEYMTHLSAEERQNGLSSYTLISYNGNTIHLRKTYKLPEYNGYYAKSFNGYIVILNGDEKTVYEYTQISVSVLPEELQKEVHTGLYLENEADLYNFLETYSS